MILPCLFPVSGDSRSVCCAGQDNFEHLASTRSRDVQIPAMTQQQLFLSLRTTQVLHHVGGVRSFKQWQIRIRPGLNAHSWEHGQPPLRNVRDCHSGIGSCPQTSLGKRYASGFSSQWRARASRWTCSGDRPRVARTLMSKSAEMRAELRIEFALGQTACKQILETARKTHRTSRISRWRPD
jgi:hypothetical protein